MSLKKKSISIVFYFSALILPSIFFTGCDSKKSGLTFINDMDMVTAWNEHPLVTPTMAENAHSGNYVCQIDSGRVFGPSFYEQIKAITPKTVSKVTISGWFYLKGDQSTPEMALDIQDKNRQTLEFLSFPVRKIVADKGIWVNASSEIDLTDKSRNNPENYLKIYFLNKNSESVLIDDMEINFE